MFSLRPGVRADYQRRYGYPDGLPLFDTDVDIRKALAGRLVMVLHFAAGDLWMPIGQELSAESTRLLATYCDLIEQASRPISSTVFQIEPLVEQIKNPLTPLLIDSLWNHPKSLPRMGELIRF